MPKKNARSSGPSNLAAGLKVFRTYVLPLLVSAAIAFGVLFAFYRADRFVASHPLFMVNPAAAPNALSPNVNVEGAAHTSVKELRTVFAKDEGRSAFHMPIAERRAELERLQWIKQASLYRVWPNRIDVKVVERTPVAFVELPGGGHNSLSRARLIDEEGYLLPFQDSRRRSLPVLTGVSEAQRREVRAGLVRKMRDLLTELGPSAAKISEIDLTDPDNVKIVYPTERRALTLILGKEDWRLRMDTFLLNLDEIREKMPNAIELDLRAPDRIYATRMAKESDGD